MDIEWQEQYRHRPYLQDASEEELADRLEYIVQNMPGLASDGEVGSLPHAPDQTYWQRLLAHVTEEYKRRNRVRPHQGARTPDLNVLRGAKKAIKSPADGTYLVKFGKRENIFDLYNHGRLKISPASSYSDPSLNSAINDDELALSSYFLQFETINRRLDKHSGEFIDPTRPLGNVTATSRIGTDYYVYCMSSKLDFRLFRDFGYDTCLVICDRQRFEKRLISVVENHPPGWLGVGRPVQYIDPFNCNPQLLRSVAIRGRLGVGNRSS
jgi:hypothetical protein